MYFLLSFFSVIMELDAVNNIRVHSRNLLKISRQIHKDQESDSRRSLQEIRLLPVNIQELASKVKTKSTVSVTDLQALKNGLINDIKNIDIFLYVHGALRGIVRELTGHNVHKQCAAAGCCCNLALGGTRACSAVAKAAGSYLVAALDNLAVELAVTCAWTLGNLAGSGSKVCHILEAQGALAKLSDIHNSEELQDGALYACLHFAYKMKDELKPDYLKKILQAILKQELTLISAHLLFILSCHDHYSENVTHDLLQKVLQDLPKCLELHGACRQTNETCCELVYLVRVLANTDRMYDVIMNHLNINNMFDNFKSVISMNNSSVNNSIYWMLGNLFNYCGDESLFLKVCC